MDHDHPALTSLDRSTFIIGLALSVFVILVGFYIIRRLESVDSFSGSPSDKQVKNMALDPIVPSAFVRDVDSNEEGAKVLDTTDYSKVVLLYANWCVHCRTMMNDYNEAASMLGNEVKFIRVEVGRAKELMKRSDISGFPTIFGVRYDGSITQHNGKRDPATLVSFAESLKKKAYIEIINGDVSSHQTT